jgi:hypothetical protein
MKKLIVFLFSVLLFSCNPKSYVSDNEAIVEFIENNKDDRNNWKYLVKAVYVNGNIDLTNDDGEMRASTDRFYLYTNTKYNVGDTIIIGDTIHKAR